MENKFIGYCPRCSNKLIATNLVCKNCELGLSSEFELSKFDYLTKDELDFIECFLKCQGSFKALQEEKGMSYPAAKRKLSGILVSLGFNENEKNEGEVFEMSIKTFAPVEHNDSLVVRLIKEKLNACGGKTTIELFQGEPCEIWYSGDGKGLASPKIPPAEQLVWESFDAAVEIVIRNGGKAKKGNARSGAKLGSEKLPVNSVEGYIASKVHGVKEGETAFGPGFVIASVLDWAGICKNERGYLSICPAFLVEYDRHDITE